MVATGSPAGDSKSWPAPQPSVHMASFHQQLCQRSCHFPSQGTAYAANQDALTLFLDLPTLSYKGSPLEAPEASASLVYSPFLPSCLCTISLSFPQQARQSPSTGHLMEQDRTRTLKLTPCLSPEDSPVPSGSTA